MEREFITLLLSEILCSPTFCGAENYLLRIWTHQSWLYTLGLRFSEDWQIEPIMPDEMIYVFVHSEKEKAIE